MLKFKNFLMSMLLLLTLGEKLQAVDNYDLGVGVGFNLGFGYGYEAFLEYKFSENTSLYVMGNVMKEMDGNAYTVSDSNNDNSGEDEVISGQAIMGGVQMRFFKYCVVAFSRTSEVASCSITL